MKIRTVLLALAVVSVLLTLPVSASEGTGESASTLDFVESLIPGEMEELLDEFRMPSLAEIISMTPGDFWALVKRYINESLYAMRAAFFSIMAITLLCAMLTALAPDIAGGAIGGAVEMVAVLCISATVTVQLVDSVTRVGETIQNCAMFMFAFAPILAILLSAYGLPATASLYNLTILGACQVISQLIARHLVPAMGVYIAFCVSAGVSKNKGLWSIAGSVKKLVSWGLGLMMTVFVGLLTLQGFMSSGADNLAIRTTKFLVGNLVPVVGSAISDALMAAQGSIQLIKSAVGTAGIVAAVLMFLPILTHTVLWRIVLSLSSACSEIMGVEAISKLLSSFADVMGVLCAIVLSVGLLMIISTAVMLAMTAG